MTDLPALIIHRCEKGIKGVAALSVHVDEVAKVLAEGLLLLDDTEPIILVVLAIAIRINNMVGLCTECH